MPEIHWIKILTDIFEDEKIKLIQSMPDGDAVTVIWFKLLTQAGKSNMGGFIGLNREMSYDVNMLSALFNKSPQTVQHALDLFSKFKMIEITDRGFIYIVNWEKHQSVDRMEKIREQTRLRVQSHREKQKQLMLDVTENALHVTQGNATDIELELEIDKEKEIKDIVPYADIVLYLNLISGASYRLSTKKTKDLIRARWNEGFTLDDFKTVIDKKCAEWKDTTMDKYLRPETLFGTKFESYLNQSSTSIRKSNEKYTTDGEILHRRKTEEINERMADIIEPELDIFNRS
jgi:uncharacterized phage protein (TIGR02220 family)/predicted phage replisome organizer